MTNHKNSFLVICTIASFCLSITASQAQHHPEPPEARSRKEIESVLAKAPQVSTENLRDLHIVLLAGEKDHGLHEHDYPRWQESWALLLGGAKSGSKAAQLNMYGPANEVDPDELEAGAPKVKVSTAWEWPSREQFQKADLIVAFAVVNWSKERNAELEGFLSRGGGFVVIHQGCVVADGAGLEDEVVNLIGLSWNWDITRWRHGPMNLDIAQSDHPDLSHLLLSRAMHLHIICSKTPSSLQHLR